MLASVAASAAQTLDRVLAVVSGQVILASDVRAFLDLGLITVDMSDPNAREAGALTRLIERRLALDEADRYRPAPPPQARIEQDLTAIHARFADEAAFTRFLAAVGLDLDDLRQILRDDARQSDRGPAADKGARTMALRLPLRPSPQSAWAVAHERAALLWGARPRERPILRSARPELVQEPA